MAVGSIEPQFFAALLDGLGLSADEVPAQSDTERHPKLERIFTERFASKTRDEWTAVFAGTDACVTPVLTWTEAQSNEHLRARRTIVDVGGTPQAAPAPRFSRSAAGRSDRRRSTPPHSTRSVGSKAHPPKVIAAGLPSLHWCHGRAGIAGDLDRCRAGCGPRRTGRYRSHTDVVVGAQRAHVIDRYDDGRPHHVAVTVKVLGLVDHEVLEYHWGRDWVVWDAERSPQQHAQHVEYTVRPEASKTRLRFDITMEPSAPLPEFPIKRAKRTVLQAATEGLRQHVMRVARPDA